MKYAPVREITLPWRVIVVGLKALSEVIQSSCPGASAESLLMCPDAEENTRVLFEFRSQIQNCICLKTHPPCVLN